ncbi:MFS general substrate transporter [Cryphonectria parasitica EP155]|uniref:MFS general substrate transporter n=1 Tax=Cryphonectria parasitica (strain ATCC 38755 / EP155) TaxID=660469 RepID=A0A9P5CVI1_CRYP1|nr:MFS general substrate transporter [Cryphonectria parasitica EP155]KAF3771126.1 MFS general substrate transporter [Cryphonectria parasitica EP155]
MGDQGEEDVVVVNETSSRHGVDDALAKRVLRKIDMRLVPLLFITYGLNFMDKTILSSASVFGLQDDTNLQGQDYSWVSSIFYFGYLAWTYPTNILIARLPVGRYMTANALVWGVVVALTAACTNYGGLLTVRFLLGAAEATITPAFMFITTSWYTRDEIPVRTGIWFSGNSIGGMVASLFAFGVGHITDSIGPWRWMYIILGAATFLWGLVLWLALPDSVSTARFLTPEERQYAADRIIVAGTGRTEAAAWSWAQARECLADPKTWFLVGLEITTQIPNGGTQNFANLVIESFGFTSLQSTLVNIPYSLLSGGCIFFTGWLAGRFRQAHCLLVAAVVLPCVVGAALIYARARVALGVQLFGYFLLCTGSSAMPLALSLVQANYRGVTKKLTVTSLLFLAYCTGNIAGPQFFRSAEAPLYQTAFRTIMICYSLAVALALGLRVYLARVNARRTRDEGFEGSAGASGAVGGGKVVDIAQGGADAVSRVELRGEDYEDVTDWQIAGFRYRL